MEKIHQVSLFLSTQSPGQVLFSAVQGDTGRKIRASIFNDNGTAFTPDSGTTAEYWSLKADKNGTQHSATISSNVVTVQLTEQDLAAPGKTYAAIVLKNGDTILAAMPFWFMVVPIPIGDDIESTSEYQMMIEATEDAEAAAENANNAAEHGPYIRNTDLHWMLWDNDDQEYKDSGVPATGAEGVVLYSAAQTLTSTEQAQARSNIGAGSSADIGNLSSLQTTEKSNLVGAINELQNETKNDTLFFKDVPVSATTGTIVSKSDSMITADHIVTQCVWANSSAITTRASWTTSAGSLVITGTCTTATTADITLVKKDN